MNHAGITEITLDRGPCFGTCPVFDFSASASGSYRYAGHAYVEPLGERTGTFPGYLFARLAEVCVDLKVLELDEVYPTDFEDSPSTTVIVRHDGGVKTVHDEGGGKAPARLWAFTVIVEHCMRAAFEIENRGQRSGRPRRRL